jgi:hypothetical protein
MTIDPELRGEMRKGRRSEERLFYWPLLGPGELMKRERENA